MDKFYYPNTLQFWFGTLPFVVGCLVTLVAIAAQYWFTTYGVRTLWSKSKIAAIGVGIAGYGFVTIGYIATLVTRSHDVKFGIWFFGFLVTAVALVAVAGWAIKEAKKTF